MKYSKVFILATAFVCFAHRPTLAAALKGPVVGPSLLGTGEERVGIDNAKGLVVVFLSAKCPCSNSHIREMANLQKDFPAFHFVAVHSNSDEGKDNTIAYFKSAALGFPIIQDSTGKIADEFKALKTPHAFVILPDGKIAYHGGVSDSHEFGTADRKYLREALNDIAQGHSVRTASARTLGCVISRGKNVW